MDVHAYRRMALELPQAIESSHMNHPDFRVGGKIFATLWPDKNEGVVMLTPEQQEVFLGARPDAFAAASGIWGRRGSTTVALDKVDEEDCRTALAMAWRNKASKKLVMAFDTEPLESEPAE
jgi:hypothetical protein